MYDSDGVLQVFNQPSLYTVHNTSSVSTTPNVTIGYNGIFSDSSGCIIALSYSTSIVDKYTLETLESNVVEDDTSFFLDCTNQEFTIQNIHRDVSGHHILELDYNVENIVMNVNLETDGGNKVINKSLQCTYTIHMSSQIMLDKNNHN